MGAINRFMPTPSFLTTPRIRANHPTDHPMVIQPQGRSAHVTSQSYSAFVASGRSFLLNRWRKNRLQRLTIPILMCDATDGFDRFLG